MPKLTDVNQKLELKLGLTPFFGEEAFITIKRMGKYAFTLLLNKNRNGYSMKMYELLTQWREENQAEDGSIRDITAQEYDDIKKSLSVEDTEQRQTVENEVNLAYFEEGIMPDKHNFTDENDKLIELSGEWFYKKFASLVSPQGGTLCDFVITEIVTFNHRGIVLGE
jgi:hypothetical protein